MILKNIKKTGNVILVNLISPRIDYRSLNKSHIRLEPFASITQDMYNFFKSVASTSSNSKTKDGNNDEKQ